MTRSTLPAHQPATRRRSLPGVVGLASAASVLAVVMLAGCGGSDGGRRSHPDAETCLTFTQDHEGTYCCAVEGDPDEYYTIDSDVGCGDDIPVVFPARQDG